MDKSFVQLVIAALITSVLCSCSRINVPLHMPNTLSNIRSYENIPNTRTSIRKLDPFPDGTPKYHITINSGSHKGQLSGVVYTDHIYARTNADTVGLKLLEDGSNTYNVKIGSYKNDTGYGELVVSVESENSRRSQQEENEKVRSEAAAARSNQLNDKHKLLQEKHCTRFSNVGYFCYDDNNKLANHDITSVSRLLRDITQVIINDKHLGNYYDIESINVVGQWYVESATDKSISVTIMMGSKLLGETVINRLSKAGKYFYITKENSTKTFK